MALDVSSNVGLQHWNRPIPLKPLSSIIPAQTSEVVSALPLISSSSGSSPRSTSSRQPTSTSSTTPGESSSTFVPQSVLNALYSYVSPTQQAWNELAHSLQLGDLSAAQTALGDYTASLSAPNDASMLLATTPSATFLQYLKAVGDAIAAGSLSDARSAFGSANFQRPDTAAQAVSSAQSAVASDGWVAVYTLEHSGSGAINQDALSSDIAGLDGALREEYADIADDLVALGYSRTDANKYAGALTGVGIASTADNAQVDAARAAQWIQGLIATAQKGTGSSGPVDQVSNNLSNALSTLLAGIESANIDSWRQLQSLIAATMHTIADSAGRSTAGNGNSGPIQSSGVHAVA